MLGAACLLLIASAAMGLTTAYLALFAVALTAHFSFRNPALEPGLFAMLGLMALWAETSLHMVQAGRLGGTEPPAEGLVAAAGGLVAGGFLLLIGIPGAEAALPLLTAAACGLAVFRKRGNAERAANAVLSLMTDPGDCRYIRGILGTIAVAQLLRRVAL